MPDPTVLAITPEALRSIIEVAHIEGLVAGLIYPRDLTDEERAIIHQEAKRIYA